MDMRRITAGIILLLLIPVSGSISATATLPIDANTTCPVMTAEPADPEIYIEHNGRTIYVCCTRCKRMFRENPHRYLPNLDAPSTTATAKLTTGTKNATTSTATTKQKVLSEAK